MNLPCAVCGADTASLIRMPGLPLTGLFTDRPADVRMDPGHDLDWLFCSACGHGQLAAPLSPQALYGDQYRFRTGASATARKGAVFFRDWVLRTFPGRRFETLLEFGCNDASLLELFAGYADCRVGVDPVLAHIEAPPAEVQLISALVEDVQLGELGRGGPDLVVCQHTLEHIVDPVRLMDNLVRQTAPGTLFAFELPCLDVLLDHGRFDQIFHEHVQYFSVRSLARLLERMGMELIDFTFNVGHWGAVLVAFRQGPSGCRRLAESRPGVDQTRICAGWRAFVKQAELVAELLRAPLAGPLLGYGAAMMLPVLDHHFGFTGAGLARVVDDDPARQGLWYRNLPVEVVAVDSVAFDEATVVLTAPDNRRAIVRRLADLAPYRIVSPLLVM